MKSNEILCRTTYTCNETLSYTGRTQQRWKVVSLTTGTSTKYYVRSWHTQTLEKNNSLLCVCENKVILLEGYEIYSNSFYDEGSMKYLKLTKSNSCVESILHKFKFICSIRMNIIEKGNHSSSFCLPIVFKIRCS